MSTPSAPALPEPGSPPSEHHTRPRDDERETRKPMSLWDRSKLLVLMGVLWGLLFWNTLVENPIITVGDAFDETVRTKRWLLLLAALELTRQLHYFVAERSPAYHAFWSKQVFGGAERRAGRMNDWNRFRIARASKWLFLVALIAVVFGAINDTSPVVALFELPRDVISALPFVLQLLLYMFLLISQFVALFWFLSKGGVDVYYPDDIKTRFSDVWGQDGVLERVKENILYLEKPETIEDKGGYVPGGILLWGPPGTGKTLMAEAVAGETGKPYVFVDPGAFQAMFVGVGILKVKSLFRRLRKLAVRYGGVIVFFDEADSLGNRGQLTDGGPMGQKFGGTQLGSIVSANECNGLSYLAPSTATMLMRRAAADHTTVAEGQRGTVNRIIMGGMGGGGMGTLQALLTELSGLKKPRGFMNRVVRRILGMRPKPPPKYRILVMMATNMPAALDEALLRPGRLDRHYKVGYPSKAGRVRTYQGYFDKVRHNLTDGDIDKLATITPYATGASIKDLVNESLIMAIRDGREVITWQDVMLAKQLKAMGPSEDGDYIDRERHSVAIHEACHAVVAYRARKHLLIDIATIERRGPVGGFVSGIPPEDRFVIWRSEYEADIMTAVASLAGERLFFDGDNSAGVSSDLAKATEIATLMEGYLGMGHTVSVHGVIHRVGIGTGAGRPGEKAPDEGPGEPHGLGDRIERNLADLLRRTEQLLRENRAAVLAVAHALETYKTVTGEDITAVIEGRQGPLIDGRVYADPAFINTIEAYHEQAVVAHQSHGAVGVPLPSPNGQDRLYGGESLVLARPRPATAIETGPAPDASGDGGPGETEQQGRTDDRDDAPSDEPASDQPADGHDGQDGNGNGNGSSYRRRPPGSPWSRP